MPARDSFTLGLNTAIYINANSWHFSTCVHWYVFVDLPTSAQTAQALVRHWLSQVLPDVSGGRVFLIPPYCKRRLVVQDSVID